MIQVAACAVNAQPVPDLEEDTLLTRLIAANIAEQPTGNVVDIGDGQASLAAGNIEHEGAANAAENMDEEALNSAKNINGAIDLLKKLLAAKSKALKMFLSPVVNANAFVREMITNFLSPRSNPQIIVFPVQIASEPKNQIESNERIKAEVIG
ncbi:hypothetical protein HN011_006731 [Eciton burchellii]|nr:hypothetical protein HN011_006731 [Eciton burchellii]